MTSSPKVVTVYCGELCLSDECNATTLNLLNRPLNGFEANITIGYEKFISDPESLSPRILDLLQLAAHIFCADRLMNRGERKSVNNESWARTVELHLPVIDIDFWSNTALQTVLSECLQFMTGDRKYSFVFEKANLSPLVPVARQLSLFTEEMSLIDDIDTADVMLLSGGLDSLAGAIERLNEHSGRNIIAVNHKGNNSVKKTQKAVVEHLQSRYQNRLHPYGFECHNKKVVGSVEETQRTRMFLFSAIAYAICECFNKHQFFVYENGITSINLPSQGDVINARASRTTHPKTIGLVKKFLRFFDANFDIQTPYCLSTKEDVFDVFKKYNEKGILSSSVSCSSTRNQPGMTNHCGCCSQCIDRRFAAYAAGVDEYDAPYSNDFITSIPDDETKQRLYYTLRLASAEKAKSAMDLWKNYPDEMNDVIEYWHCDNPEDSLGEVYTLFARFGDSVLRAAQSMRTKHDDLSVPASGNSFLSMLSTRDYLKTPTHIRVDEIDKVLRTSIPQAFHTDKPKSENDFNDTVQALLSAAGNTFTREYPVLKFGITNYRADLADDSLLIESKYLRGSTTPSTATEAISADITKISKALSVLFVVYDPERKISNDDDYISSFEKIRQDCFVKVYR
jgi:7-cyano-7-deazaguanine synthase in queuosine biosynthesis